jgi:hypothetical protein
MQRSSRSRGESRWLLREIAYMKEFIDFREMLESGSDIFQIFILLTYIVLSFLFYYLLLGFILFHGNIPMFLFFFILFKGC